MAAPSTSTGYIHPGNQSNALFEQYAPELAQEIAMRESKLWAKFATPKRGEYAKSIGATWNVKVQIQFNERGNFAGAYDLTFPASGYGNYANLTVTEKALYHIMQIDVRGWKARMGDKKATITGDIGVKEIRDAGTVHAREKSRQIFQDGRGILGTVAATTSSSTTLTVSKTTAQGGWGAQYIRRGMFIDVKTTAAASEIDSIQVTDVAYGDTVDTLTLASAQSATAGSYVYKEDHQKTAGSEIELYGLRSLTDDGTLHSTFQGQTVSSASWFKGNVDNPTNTRAFSTSLLDTMINKIWKRRESTDGLLLVSNRGMKTEYKNIGQSVFVVNANGGGATAFNLGANEDTLKYGTEDWLIDPNCPYGCIYVIVPRDIFKLVVKEFGPHDVGLPQGNWQWTGTNDTVKTYMAAYLEMYAALRSHMGFIGKVQDNTV